MPEVFRMLGYKIFFYSGEGNEPCHIHVGKNHKNASKIWIEPSVLVAHNNAQIPMKDLNKILRWVHKNKKFIIEQWNQHFAK